MGIRAWLSANPAPGAAWSPCPGVPREKLGAAPGKQGASAAESRVKREAPKGLRDQRVRMVATEIG